MDCATWVLALATAVLALATIVLAVASVHYAKLTGKLLEEQHLANKKLLLPNIELILRQSERFQQVLTLVVRNTSEAQAYDIRLSYSPPDAANIGTCDMKLLGLRLFKEPIPVLAGGETLVSDIIDIAFAKGVTELVLSAEYRDAYGELHSASFKYDLRQLAGLRRVV